MLLFGNLYKTPQLLKVTPMWEALHTIDCINGIKVERSDVANYNAFRSRFRRRGEAEECLLGKYYVVQRLLEKGCASPYLDATYSFGSPPRKVQVDVYGQCNGETLVGLCQSATTRGQLYRKLEYMSSAPAKMMVMLPLTQPLKDLRKRFPSEFITGKFTASFIPDPGDEMVGLYKEAFGDGLFIS